MSRFSSVQARTPLSRLGFSLVLFFGVLLSLLISAPLASAHDSVESTAPASGTKLVTMPEQVSLTLNNTPAAIGSKIEVKDASGTDWASGEVSVVDKVASEQLKAGAPSGQYTVNWRLVSSDGHPIDGTFSFTVTSGAAPSPGATLGSAGPVSTPEAQAQVSSGGFPWLIVIVAVLAAAVLAVLLIVVRRLRKDQ